MMLLQFCDSVETKIKKWVFTGSIDSTSDENLPGELYCFFKWIVQGPSTTSVEEKSSKVHKGAASLAQSTISLTLTERQSKNKKPEVIIVTGEMPQQLGVGLAIHQAFAVPWIWIISVEYNRLLRVEAQIAQSFTDLLFAVDNIDF